MSGPSRRGRRACELEHRPVPEHASCFVARAGRATGGRRSRAARHDAPAAGHAQVAAQDDAALEAEQRGSSRRASTDSSSGRRAARRRCFARARVRRLDLDRARRRAPAAARAARWSASPSGTPQPMGSRAARSDTDSFGSLIRYVRRVPALCGRLRRDRLCRLRLRCPFPPPAPSSLCRLLAAAHGSSPACSSSFYVPRARRFSIRSQRGLAEVVVRLVEIALGLEVVSADLLLLPLRRSASFFLPRPSPCQLNPLLPPSPRRISLQPGT